MACYVVEITALAPSGTTSGRIDLQSHGPIIIELMAHILKVDISL
jgi:hypothetical protein